MTKIQNQARELADRLARASKSLQRTAESLGILAVSLQEMAQAIKETLATIDIEDSQQS